MPVAAGTRLGPYDVVGLLGAGGMGEVFRARDPRLGRDVAIKVLPPEYAQAPDRLRRFEQEARLAGSLSHPNVLTSTTSAPTRAPPTDLTPENLFVTRDGPVKILDFGLAKLTQAERGWRAHSGRRRRPRARWWARWAT